MWSRSLGTVVGVSLLLLPAPFAAAPTAQQPTSPTFESGRASSPSMRR